MQKLLLASTLVLAASIGVAKAQTATETPPQTTQRSEGGAIVRGMTGGEMSGRGMREPPEGIMMTAHMMAHTTGAIFRIQRGDTAIFIKCAENESTQACVTAAGTLLDKFSPQPPRP
jgi:hypothetical protein